MLSTTLLLLLGACPNKRAPATDDQGTEPDHDALVAATKRAAGTRPVYR